jgi:hypothetical protein
MAAWRFAVATPVTVAYSCGVLPGRGRLCPGAKVLRACAPGQEPFQCRSGERLPAVAAAFVEVGDEIGEDVQAGHLRGCGDGPDHGGVAGRVTVAGAADVLPGHDGAADLALRFIVILIRISSGRLRPQPDEACPVG